MITISTALLKKAVAKVERATGKNQLIPITQMIGIKVRDNKMYFCSTDQTNNMQFIIDKVQVDDISITVLAETFAKLVAKVTSDSTTLDIQDNVLVVKANGDYKIPLEVDEDGVIDFPDIKFNKVGKKVSEVNLTTINNIISINKAALATDFTNPFLTGYYIGDKIISTDNENACGNSIEFSDTTTTTPILVSPQLMYLLSLNDGEKIKFIHDGKTLYFYTPDMIVMGTQLDGIDDYPVNELGELFEESFPASCKLAKGLLLSVLDRLQIFIEPYDKNGANFVFTADGITISSKRSSSTETINYSESNNFQPFTCGVDIPMFKEQLVANPAEIVELHYGLDNAIKLTNGKVVQVISLMVDDEDVEG